MSWPENILIVLPLPPRELSPNYKPGTIGSRMKVARLTKDYRSKAKDAALAEVGESPHWPTALARLKFYWPHKRRRDIRNAEGAMKAAYDGIVDAGLIKDDDATCLTHLPTEFEIDRCCPRVEIAIVRVS